MAITLVRWAGDGRPFSQAGLARAVGLSRPTACHYLAIWVAAGVVERVDDAGAPEQPGAQYYPGKAALYRLAPLAWSEELIALMPPEWREKLALAWAALQAGAPDEFIGSCLRRRPAENGTRALRLWLDRNQRRQELRQAREERARIAAQDRTERSLRMALELAGWNSTPPETEHRLPPHHGPVGAGGASRLAPRSAHAREARRGKPRSWAEPGAAQDRRDVTDRLVETVTEAEVLRAELSFAADQLGDPSPGDSWRQARNLARSCGKRLSEVVGLYVQAQATVRDCQADAREGRRGSVGNPAAFVWGIVRMRLGATRYRPEMSRGRTPDGTTLDPAPQPQPPKYEPSAEPEMEGPVAPRRSLAGMLEAARASRSRSASAAESTIPPVAAPERP